jgi:hypothetical protein
MLKRHRAQPRELTVQGTVFTKNMHHCDR